MTRRTIQISSCVFLLSSLACSWALAVVPAGPHQRALTTKAPQESADAFTPPKPFADNPPPIYPERSLARREEGSALVRALVSETGSVSAVELSESSGMPALDAAALQAVSQWRFEPASREGRPVALWIEAPVDFKIQADPNEPESQRVGSLWRL